MATGNKFPPDVPTKGWDEAKDEIGDAADGLRAKATDAAGRATEAVKDGYYRAKESMADPAEAVREAGRYAQEGGEVVVRAVERHPIVAFGLGALSVGLIAWASLRPAAPQWEPDYGRLRRLFHDYGGDDAVKAGEGAVRDVPGWLRSYGASAQDYARDYAESGRQLLTRRAEREPLAAIVGVGLAIYVLGSLLSSAASSDEPESPRRRSTKR